MFHKWCNKCAKFFANCPMLNSVVHLLGGFGLAIVLEQYLDWEMLFAPMTGWILILVMVAVHIRALMK